MLHYHISCHILTYAVVCEQSHFANSYLLLKTKLLHPCQDQIPSP